MKHRTAARLSTIGLWPMLWFTACNPGGGPPAAPARGGSPPITVAAPLPEPEPVPGAPRVVYLGDSLTAGYGLAEEQAFPALVGERLAAEGTTVETINAGVSGDTTAAGLARLDWVLRQEPALVVVGLGGNDGLRGLQLEQTRANLRQILTRCQASGAAVLLLGMQIPPSYGADYANGFAAMYPALAKELGVPLVPFLLEGVAGDAALNQADGIHPTAEGQARVAATVAPHVRAALAALGLETR